MPTGDDFTLLMPDGTCVVVVDGLGKPVVLGDETKVALRRALLAVEGLSLERRRELTLPIHDIGELLRRPPDDTAVRLAALVEKMLEEPKPPRRDYPQPRKSKRERRGSWKR